MKKRFSKFASSVAALGMFLTTNLFYYMFLEGSLSHGVSFFVMSLVIWKFMTIYDGKNNKKDYFIMGLLLGILYIVRTQDALYALIPGVFLLVDVIKRFAKKHVKLALKSVAKGIIMILGFCIPIIPQQLSLYYYHGQFFSSSKYYFLAFHDNTNLARIINIFISPDRGIISWHPIFLLGLIGLLFYIKKNKENIYLLVGLFAQVILISYFFYPGAGQAFGARYFLSAIPIFFFGLACLVSNLGEKYRGNKKSKRGFFAVVIILLMLGTYWNMGLMMQYGSRMIDKSTPTSFKTLLLNNIIEVPQKAFELLNLFFVLRKGYGDQSLTILDPNGSLLDENRSLEEISSNIHS
jgi:hypothetical protein